MVMDMKEKTAVFIGHNNTTGLDTKLLEQTVIDLVQKNITSFVSGGMGGFDRAAARAVYDLKKYYPQIKNYLVIPYLHFNIFNSSLFDEIIFPEELEGVPYKAAIPKRNRYMVGLSGTAVCFVKYTTGGAAKSFCYAEKQGLEMINLV